MLVFAAQADNLTITAKGPDGAIAFRRMGAFYEPGHFALPLSLLAECAGRQGCALRLEVGDDQTVCVSWDERGVPRTRTSECVPLPPDSALPSPKSWLAVDSGLLMAFRDAVETTDHESSRFALGCLQLRGESGEIVATDGKQLLIQGGFTFPWRESLLVSAPHIFGCREFATQGTLAIGRTDQHVCLQIGDWTLNLPINTEGRFPRPRMSSPQPRPLRLD